MVLESAAGSWPWPRPGAWLGWGRARVRARRRRIWFEPHGHCWVRVDRLAAAVCVASGAMTGLVDKAYAAAAHLGPHLVGTHVGSWPTLVAQW